MRDGRSGDGDNLVVSFFSLARGLRNAVQLVVGALQAHFWGTSCMVMACYLGETTSGRWMLGSSRSSRDSWLDWPVPLIGSNSGASSSYLVWFGMKDGFQSSSF